MSTPLRILHVTTSWPRRPDDPDGRFVAALVAAQRAAGHDVRVAFPPRNGVLGDLRSPARWPRLLRALVALWRAARPLQDAWPAEVVHAHWWPCAAIALLHGRTRSLPVVVTLHGSDVELLRPAPLRWLGRRVLGRASSVHAVSGPLADRARGLLGADAPAIAVTRNGDDDVRVPDIDPAARTGIVFAGHLERHKGVLDLPVLAAALRARGRTHELEVYGDGAQRSTLERRLREQRGTGVRMHGAVPHQQLLDAICDTAIVVCPSYVEGFGLVCQEAIARGVPVVAYATGGLMEQLAPDASGFAPGRLVETGDVNALADAVVTVLADDELRRAVHERARAAAATVRSWCDVAGDYDAAYRAGTTATTPTGKSV